jgi:hypothetical protein
MQLPVRAERTGDAAEPPAAPGASGRQLLMTTPGSLALLSLSDAARFFAS